MRFVSVRFFVILRAFLAFITEAFSITFQPCADHEASTLEHLGFFKEPLSAAISHLGLVQKSLHMSASAQAPVVASQRLAKRLSIE